MEDSFWIALVCLSGGFGLMGLLIVRSTRPPKDNRVSYEIQAHNFVENYCKFSDKKDLSDYRKEALRKLKEEFTSEEEIRKENRRLEKLIKQYNL